MDTDQKSEYSELLRILEEAVQREISAAKLYREGAAKANYQRAKELLEKLSKEEEHHREILTGLYQEIAGAAMNEGEL